METIEKDSFVVISDFHACDWPLKIITENYLNKYDKIYILGDATDRGEDGIGTGGVDLLLRIKELTEKYPNRVIYIPGNHDELLYDYAVTTSLDARRDARINIKSNHGDATIKDINILKAERKDEFSDLFIWLGNLPLQRDHFYKGKRYVLAHALFNEKLFQENRNFSLCNYTIDNNGNDGPYCSILWFRKDDSNGYGYYKPSTLPEKGTKMIIGHTPLHYREGQNLDLENTSGDAIEVICVDGGIASGCDMLKYEVSSENEGVLTAEPNPAKKAKIETPKEYSTEDIAITNDMTGKEKIKIDIDRIILEIIVSYGKIEFAVDILNSLLNRPKEYIEYEENGLSIKLKKADVNEYLTEIYSTHMKAQENGIEPFEVYFIEVALNYIVESLYEKYKDSRIVIQRINDFIRNPDGTFLTEIPRKARNIANKIGKEYYLNLWHEYNSYQTIEDYVKDKIGKQYRI